MCLVLPPTGWWPNLELWHHYPDISFLLIFYPESVTLTFSIFIFWLSSILVVFHFVCLLFWLSSILFVFYFGHPHFGRLPFYSSSILVVFHLIDKKKMSSEQDCLNSKDKEKCPQHRIFHVTGAATLRMVPKLWSMAPLSRYFIFINILPQVQI